MKQKLIIGNWKLNPDTVREAKEIFNPLKRSVSKLAAVGAKGSVEVVICPPAVYLSDLAKLAGEKIKLGAQDTFYETLGAYTGELGASMLAHAGASYVLLGHSERRRAGDADGTINRKLRRALAVGLRPVLCVGEERRDPDGFYLQTLRTQLEEGLRGLSKKDFAALTIAYEPVWAIGAEAKGSDTPRGFLEQAIYIRKVIAGLAGKEAALKLPVLYGGSVDQNNAAGFLGDGEADGLLVGRASLDPQIFIETIKLAQ